MCLSRPTAAVLAVLLTAAALPFSVLPPAAAATTTAPAHTQDRGGQDEETEPTPLTVRLSAMTPATVPVRGAIELRGSVTNDSATTWQDVNVLPFISDVPITTREQLAEQAATDESAAVAERLTDPRMFVSIGDLEPGQTQPFQIRMPRRLLPISGEAGAYWIGAHALGTNDDGRDSFADGRVRTFIPLVPPESPRTSVALVLPLREEVNRTADGQIAGASSWARELDVDGALGRLLGLAESAGALPFTWLIDPADLEAAADLAEGNPPMSLGEAEPEGPDQSPSPTPEGGAAGSSAPTASPEEVAADWLERLVDTTRSQLVLGLGYGDPDVAALSQRQPEMLDKARSLAQSHFTARDIAAAPAVAPPAGWLDEDTVASLDAEMVILSDHGNEQERTHWSTGTGASLVLGDQRVLAGGPAPSEPLHALALRQRILADAALRALDGADSPMPVVLPAGWDPGPDWRSADFFEGLGQRWLSLVTLGPGPSAELPTYADPLRYPQRIRQREIGQANVQAAADLIDVGMLFDELLETTNDVYREVLGTALSAVSYNARDEQAAARERVRDRTRVLTEKLDALQVQLGTDFVTLSGGEGTLTASLVNELERPVTVGIRAYTEDPGVTLSAPDPVTVGPGERVAVRLQAEASTIGVHQVVLSPVTVDGHLVGDPVTFNLRTSQVGRLIWYILVGVGALLAVAIVLRIVHRVRSHRWRK